MLLSAAATHCLTKSVQQKQSPTYHKKHSFLRVAFCNFKSLNQKCDVSQSPLFKNVYPYNCTVQRSLKQNLSVSECLHC